METEQPWWSTDRGAWLGSAGGMIAAAVLLAITASTTIAVVFGIVGVLFAVFGLQGRDLMGRRPTDARRR